MKEKWSKIIFLHLALAAAFTVMIPTIWHCPVRLLFGVPCPGCGVTRAVLCALRLDFAGAFSYHPVFPLVILLFLYGIHRETLLRKAAGRWNYKVEMILLIAVIAIIIGTYVFRLIRQDSPVMEICPEKGWITRLFRVFCR